MVSCAPVGNRRRAAICPLRQADDRLWDDNRLPTPMQDEIVKWMAANLR